MERSLEQVIEGYREALKEISKELEGVNRGGCVTLEGEDLTQWTDKVDMIHDALGHTVSSFQARYVFPVHVYSGEMSPAERVIRVTHAIWTKQMQASDWTWGPQMNTEKKRHPLIKAYDDLTDDEKAEVRAHLVEPITDIVSQAGLMLVDATESGPGSVPIDINVSDFAQRIIEGPGGMNVYEEREAVDWGVSERVAAAEWAIRCLANPDCAGSHECLQMIMLRRAEMEIQREQEQKAKGN